MSYSKKMYIGGKLTDGKAAIDVINPANDLVAGTVAVAGPGDVDNALQAARDAFPIWSKTPLAERQAWMSKLRDEVIRHEEHLRDCIHQEMGKPWGATGEDFDSLKNALHYYSEEIMRVQDEILPDREGTHSHRLKREPIGVVAAFIAWNFPLLNLAFKIAPAMATGCPIIIRPSEATPISAYAVGELCAQIGLPDGVVQILCTDSHKTADIISSSEVPALVTLIGSTRTGRHIMKTGATTIKRYSMELGGNAPVLVFEDADLDLAADIVCAVKFNNAGQICVSPNRVFVQSSIAEAFAEKVTERAKDTPVGFDRNADIVTGPMIDQRAWTRVKALIDDAIANGAGLLAGGDRPMGLKQGHFLAPTVLKGVTDNMQIYQSEIFGPVVSLVAFDDADDVLRQANDCDDGGLVAYIFTRNLARAGKYAAGLRYGEIQINGVKYGIDLPHGGIGQSGIGHDCSRLALDDYLIIKRITRAFTGADE